MKKVFLLLTIFIGTMSVKAQENGWTCADAGCYDQVGVGQNYDYSNVYSASRAISFPETEANKTLINDFQTATIYVNGESKIYSSRYNPISNEIEIKGEDDIVYNLRRVKDVKIVFNETNQSYKAVVYKNAFGQEMIDYFNILNNNDLLLKRISYTYIKAKKAKTSYDKSKPSYYKEKINYYFVDSNDKLVGLNTKKRDIKNRYEKNSTEILAYIKSHRIDDSIELDLLKLATYIKSLQSTKKQDTRLVKNK
nr:hypothetical protein [uncultured Psychroserpens sp.]